MPCNRKSRCSYCQRWSGLDPWLIGVCQSRWWSRQSFECQLKSKYPVKSPKSIIFCALTQSWSMIRPNSRRTWTFGTRSEFKTWTLKQSLTRWESKLNYDIKPTCTSVAFVHRQQQLPFPVGDCWSRCTWSSDKHLDEELKERSHGDQCQRGGKWLT